MKKVLAIYYTQSGQLKRILDSVLSPLIKDKDFEIDYLKLAPVNEYPFPWGSDFFNCFPESVNGIPCKMQPYTIDFDTQYDLIILAHQPWFLSTSIPFWSFLVSKEASILLKGKNIVTIIGARNMWAGSQEIIKKKLFEIGAVLKGNIVLQDRADNIIAGFTIIKWLVHGKKGPSLFLPEAGVSNKDILNASDFGVIIASALKHNKLEQLQEKLKSSGAVKVKYHLLNIEITARKIFCKFADLAIKQTEKGDKQRQHIVKLFKGYLLFALFIISPFVSLIFMIFRIVLFPLANKKISYYRGIELKM
jgi:hypothetical protein